MSDRSFPQGSPAPGASKQDVIECFGGLLTRFGGRLVSLIGADATAAVLRSALLAARREYPVLYDLEVSEAGGHVAPLWADLENVDHIELQNSLVAYLDGVVALVSDITGEVFVLKIAPLVQQFQQRLED